MKDQVKAIVLFANPWMMEDEKTGQKREGVTIEYVMTDNLNPVVNEDGSVGYRHIKETLPVTKMNQIVKVPGIYDMQYGLRISKGKPIMKLENISFVKEIIGVK